MWPFRNPKADLLVMLKEILLRISDSSFDPGCSEFRTREEATKRYEDLLGEVEKGMATGAVRRLRSEFAPTGNLQELAMANGWHGRYMAMAKRFDKLERSF
ncbi:MAG TPA: hypothetical protein VFF77_04180 [Holophagaceae bacterium]|nr:hypothetical protein [Holophagaceae bacterium]